MHAGWGEAVMAIWRSLLSEQEISEWWRRRTTECCGQGYGKNEGKELGGNKAMEGFEDEDKVVLGAEMQWESAESCEETYNVV